MAVVAYLDPGAGGLIASTAAAGLAGAAVVARSGWRKAKDKLKRTRPDDAPADDAGIHDAGDGAELDTADAGEVG